MIVFPPITYVITQLQKGIAEIPLLVGKVHIVYKHLLSDHPLE